MIDTDWASVWVFGFLSKISERFSHCVVGDEPVVDVEHDEEGGEAGDGDDVKDARVVDHKSDSVLVLGSWQKMLANQI